MPHRHELTWVLAPFTVALLGYATLEAGDPTPEPTPIGPVPVEVVDGFEWFWTLKGPHSADAGGDMVADLEGNVFISGFHGGLDLDDDDNVDLLAESSDAFFLKLSPRSDGSGMAPQWIQSPRSPGFHRSTALAPDQQGGAYAVGRFRGTVTFDPDLVLAGGGGNDAYFARYGATGDLLWARAFGGAAEDVLMDVASDPAGNAYVVGWGAGAFPLDDAGTEFRAGEGQSASLIASYDPDGMVRWAVVVAAPVRPYAVEIGPDGEVLVSGDLEGAVDFNHDGVVDLQDPADHDGFVARFDSDGNFLGAWPIGAGFGRMTVAANGDLLLLGMLGGPAEERYGVADFDGDGIPDAAVRGVEPTSAWVARYARQGDLKWVRSYAMGQPGGLTAEGGRVVITGSYLGIQDVDEDGTPERVDHTVDPMLESELAILVVSELDGTPKEVWTAPGPGRDHAAGAVFIPGSPFLYVTGYIQLTADFTGDGKDGEGWAKCEALGDVFFARYRMDELEQAITLAATLSERSGVGVEAELAWTGMTSGQVDIYRNDLLVTTTANRSPYRDSLRGRGPGPHTYRICEAGTSRCSSGVIARF